MIPPPFDHHGGLEVFCIFTPLYRRFRPSRISQTVDIEEIYRFISKILDFMPCGSVFGHFCVLCTNLMALASKIYRKSIENLSKIYRTSIKHLSKIYRTSIENLSNIYRKSIEKMINAEPYEVKLRIFDTKR